MRVVRFVFDILVCSEKTYEEVKKKMKTLYYDNAILMKFNREIQYRLTTNLIFQELVVKFVFQYETVKANIKP